MPLLLSSPPPPRPSTNSPMNTRAETKRSPVGGSGSMSARPSPCPARPVLDEKSIMTSRPPRAVLDKEMVVEEDKPRFPTAIIDTEGISDVMAARLATCLLGHVLFLKSQVPFPVAQLMRMAARSPNSGDQLDKKLDKLLTSFDLLSSHLGSTFTALSSAFSYKYNSADTSVIPSTSRSARVKIEKVHLAIVLGPSATATHALRARVVLELDGLRVRVAPHGPSTYSTSSRGNQTRTTVNSHLKENEGPSLARIRPENAPRSPMTTVDRSKGLRERVSRTNDLDDSDSSADEKEECFGNEELYSSTVQPPPNSDSESDCDCDSDPDASLDVEDESDESSDEDSDMSDPSSTRQEETEADLNAAERLLSRALAIANSDPELGMAADIRPTQTHILIRAPRRFSHPSWKPKQEITRDLDRLLSELEGDERLKQERQASGAAILHDITNMSAESKTSSKENVRVVGKKVDTRRKEPGGIKTDYVRVRSQWTADQARMASTELSDGTLNAPDQGNESQKGESGGSGSGLAASDDDYKDEGEGDEEHDDEMIWWCWEGKLEGFADL